MNSSLLIAEICCLLKIRNSLSQNHSEQVLKICDRCKAVCNASIAIILSLFGLSLLWTIFIVVAFYLPSQHLSSLPLNLWQLMFYVAVAANLAFHLIAKKEIEDYRA